MAVWSETNLKEVHKVIRFDGEYFLPKYVENEAILSKCPNVPIPKHFIVSDGNHMSVAKHFTKNDIGIPYFRGQDVNSFYLASANPVKIPSDIYQKPVMHRSHFQSADVLLSIVGTIGSLSIVPENFGPATGSCKIAILRSKGVMDPYYLAVFLLTEFGQLQVKRNTRGAVQMGLILKDIVRIRVPLLNITQQKEISELAKKSIELNNLSQSLYTQAQELLERELGLDKLVFDKPLSYEARLSEVFTGNRIDAQCYKPDYINYEKYIRKNCKYALLRPLLNTIVKGNQQTYSLKGTVDYVSIKDIHGIEVVSDGYCKSQTNLSFANKDDLLLAITGATIGKVGIVHRYKKITFSGDLLCLQANQDLIDSHYLVSVFQNPIIQSQCRRWISGSTNGHLSPLDVGRFVIPRLPLQAENDISLNIKKSLQTKIESQLLLEQAKHRVEELIEQAVQK